ncbi:transposase [Tenacibaculum tangerinum]|uniref:Transposase n=1 Tax=Tenacibaculum tangerinum TaxID=3038772 RepID=A0ABY8L505_9FLAO|nr:transposase [Tenacibaculum tangerinum]WGH74054.1 transposase [Tenacibaculum tangerinum]WGH75225.1 transposase [Tenacibaculum tangerinum]
MVNTFGIHEQSTGRNYLFSPKGRLGLMFLKHYANCSDKKLIEQLNSNLDYQFFCDIELGFERLTNYKIVSQIRCELSEKLEISSVEKVLFSFWKGQIESANQIVMDATCYESELSYPSIQKLLWQSAHWLYKQLQKTCSVLGVKMIRSKYLKWKKRYQGFSKMRRKTKSKRISLTRALLKLLLKFINFEKELQIHSNLEFTPQYYKRITTIQKIYEQQKHHFDTGEKIKDRIVSIHKDYIRPIVRGKEVKPVEFGAKVNKVQIDGISFIEHINFNAFHEGNRFIQTVQKVQGLTRKKVKIAGADKIYATNKNRKYCSSKAIQTDFIPKGKKSKNHKEKQKLRAIISKERATRLEGSFGKDKEHYHLKKIKAKTKKNEILWIFFGIHTGNALEIGRRKAREIDKKTA